MTIIIFGSRRNNMFSAQYFCVPQMIAVDAGKIQYQFHTSCLISSNFVATYVTKVKFDNPQAPVR